MSENIKNKVLTRPFVGKPVWQTVYVEQPVNYGYGGRSRAYVTNHSSNTVSLLDIPSGRKILDIPVGNKPYGIDISPDKKFIYVANSGDATLSIILARSNQVVHTISLNTDAFPASCSYWVKVSADGRLIYVTNKNSDNISVVDAKQRKVITAISFPYASNPLKLDIAVEGKLAYVTLFNTSQVAVVDLTVNLPVKYIDVGKEPSGIAVAKRTPLILAVNSGGFSLSVIDALLAEVSPYTIAAGDPADVIIDPYGRIAYVSNWSADNNPGYVGVIDIFSNRQIVTLLVGINPKGLALTNDGRFLVVTNLGEATVSIINTKIREVVATVSVGNDPEFVAILN